MAARPLTVLVVDDDADIRLLVRRLSPRYGYTVVGEVGDCAEAIDLALNLQPDVAVLNVDLPNLDGIAAIKPIRTRSPRTRIVMFSGYDEQRDRAMAAGADAWVTKSSEWWLLMDAIERVTGEP